MKNKERVVYAAMGILIGVVIGSQFFARQERQRQEGSKGRETAAIRGSQPRVPAGTAPASNAFGEDLAPIVMWQTADFAQSFIVTDNREVRIGELERDPVTAQWTNTAYESTTSFDILCGQGNGLDRVFLAGQASNGDAVIERWVLKPKQFGGGGPGGGPPGGGGGVAKVIRKTEIYRGPLGGAPMDVGADPEGRFVLLLVDMAATRAIFRFDNVANATPEFLYDTNDIPLLADTDQMDRFNHGILGRIWELKGPANTPGGRSIVILVDANNDGQFEDPPISGEWHALQGQGLYDLNLWAHFRGDGS